MQDPDKFCASVEAEQQALREKLMAATARLPDIRISTDTKLKISEVSRMAACRLRFRGHDCLHSHVRILKRPETQHSHLTRLGLMTSIMHCT